MTRCDFDHARGYRFHVSIRTSENSRSFVRSTKQAHDDLAAKTVMIMLNNVSLMLLHADYQVISSQCNCMIAGRTTATARLQLMKYAKSPHVALSNGRAGSAANTASLWCLVRVYMLHRELVH